MAVLNANQRKALFSLRAAISQATTSGTLKFLQASGEAESLMQKLTNNYIEPEDFAMSAEQLAAKYAEASQHNVFNQLGWIADVRNGETLLSYWDWVVRRLWEETHEEVTGEVPDGA